MSILNQCPSRFLACTFLDEFFVPLSLSLEEFRVVTHAVGVLRRSIYLIAGGNIDSHRLTFLHSDN